MNEESLPNEDWFELEFERLVDQFEQAWQSGNPPDIGTFLERGEAAVISSPELLQELVRVDLSYRWSTREGKTGSSTADRLILEDYQRRFPGLALSLDLIVDEYQLRSRAEVELLPSEYFNRFPQFADQLLAVLPQSPPFDRTCLPADETDQDSRLDPSPRSLQASPVPAKLPQRVGRYEVRSELGRGGFGVVYLADDPVLQRQVAIKTPHARIAVDPAQLAECLREARLVAALRHPGLVQVFDVVHEKGRDHIVMECIGRSSLRDRLAEGPLEPRLAAQVLASVAAAVHEAHRVGVTHRDLKPANILLDEFDHPHVTDFGLAVHNEARLEPRRALAGTPAYMAPEQVLGRSPLDGRTDVWSLGIVLYEMLTGRLPFSGDVISDLYDDILQRDPKPPRQIDDRIDQELERICLKCLAKKVTDRYTTAKDLSEDLEQSIRAFWLGAPADSTPPPGVSAGSVRRTNVPWPSDRFIGRVAELEQLEHRLLKSEAALITLTGPGGVGKTRLSLELARRVQQRFPGGCWWVDLTQAESVVGVAQAVLAALEVTGQDSGTAQQLVSNVLELRRPLLLILDNFDRAVSAAAESVGLWRSHAPHVRFLITSRSPLHLAGERPHELTPLGVPAAPGPEIPRPDWETSESVELFLERSREARSKLQLDETTGPVVAEICRRLEGIPLAIELAAARMEVLTPKQILTKLERKFELLKSSRGDLPARQRTLAATIAWSVDLLPDYQRDAFLQASIFPAGFFLESAEAVLDLQAFSSAPPTLDVIQSLREQCLLRTRETRFGHRFEMYHAIRDFGQQQRQQQFKPHRQDALARRFACHLVEYGEHCQSKIHTQEGPEALDRLDLETENLFAVQDRALAAGDFDLAARAILALFETLFSRHPAELRMERIQRSMVDVAPELELGLLVALSRAAQTVGDGETALTAAERAIGRCQALGDSPQTARAWLQRAELHRSRGDLQEAWACYEKVKTPGQGTVDPPTRIAAIIGQGFVAWQRGQFREAQDAYQSARQLAEQQGDLVGLGTIAHYAGHLLAQQGDYQGAMSCFREAERLARQRGDRRGLHRSISGKAMVLSETGQLVPALEAYGEAETIVCELGEKRGIAVNQGNRALVLMELGRHPEALSGLAMAEAINREMHNTAAIALNIGNRALALAATGQVETAMASLEQAQQLNERLGNRRQVAINKGDLGVILEQVGRLEEAQILLQEAVATLVELGSEDSLDFFNFLSALAVAQATAGKVDQSRQTVERVQRVAERLGIDEGHPHPRIRASFAALQKLTPRSANG